MLAHDITESVSKAQYRSLSSLVVKITSRCNIKCHYCYESITFGKEPHYYLPLEKFKTILTEVIGATDKKKINIILHGGEPSLLPPDYIIDIAKLSHGIASEYGKKVSLAMQTNFISISDEMLDAIKYADLSLGVSLDNPEHLESSMRPLARKVIQNYYRAIEKKISCGLLSTINQSNYHLFSEFCGWLYSDIKVKNFKANVAYSVGKGINIPDMQPDQVFTAQKAIVDYMISHEGKGLLEHNLAMMMINYVDSALKRMNVPDSLCGSKQCGAGKEVIGITPEGNILPCGRFTWNERKYFLSEYQENKTEIKSQNIIYDKRLKDFFSIKEDNWVDCNACEAKAICEFGCQAFIARSKSQINVECTPTKLLFNYFNELKDEILTIYPIIKYRMESSNIFSKISLQGQSTSPHDFSREELSNLREGIQSIYELENALILDKGLTHKEAEIYIKGIAQDLQLSSNIV